MLSLKDKLKQFDKPSDPQTDEFFEPPAIPKDFQYCETEHGKFILRQKQFKLDFIHGQTNIGSIFNVEVKKIAYLLKDSNFKSFDVSKVLFIDTETTGLAGGTGTYAFLIGIGMFIENEFILKQYILQNPAQECAQLLSIIHDVMHCEYIVSYNGKSYDLPLLATRFILNKLDNPFAEMYHIDLLHINRRFYGIYVDSCSLQSMESYLLGFQRYDDIPGSEIPQLYFHFLQHQDLHSLLPVCKHNSIDILSMIAFLIENAKIFQQDSTEIKAYNAKAKLNAFLELNQTNLALEFAQKSKGDDPLFLRLKARFYKQQQLYPEALQIWEYLCGLKSFSEEPFVEQAKIYEHQLKEHQLALEIIERLEKKIAIRRELTGERIIIQDDLKKRTKRLLSKIHSV